MAAKKQRLHHRSSVNIKTVKPQIDQQKLAEHFTPKPGTKYPVPTRVCKGDIFECVARLIVETCDIPIEIITPASHAIDDLGIDSLDFLDIAFAIEKAFGIKLPMEQWTQEINDGKATSDKYFMLNNLCLQIEELVAAKKARASAPA